MDIFEIIKAVSDSPITTFEMEQGDLKLKLKKEVTGQVVAPVAAPVAPVQAVAPVEAAPAQQAAPVEAVAAQQAAPAVDNCQYITAPMVGTFYASSAPDKPAYVKVGDKVKKGQVVCIVEAMKLMNEIESDVDGEIVEILVGNEDMVEFGQKLFVVK